MESNLLSSILGIILFLYFLYTGYSLFISKKKSMFDSKTNDIKPPSKNIHPLSKEQLDFLEKMTL